MIMIIMVVPGFTFYFIIFIFIFIIILFCKVCFRGSLPSYIVDCFHNIGHIGIICTIWHHCFQYDNPNPLHNLNYKIWCFSIPPFISSLIHVISTFIFLILSIIAFIFEIIVAHRVDIYPLNEYFKTTFIIITIICLAADIGSLILLFGFLF